jgi:hypothetical protein
MNELVGIVDGGQKEQTAAAQGSLTASGNSNYRIADSVLFT